MLSWTSIFAISFLKYIYRMLLNYVLDFYKKVTHLYTANTLCIYKSMQYSSMKIQMLVERKINFASLIILYLETMLTQRLMCRLIIRLSSYLNEKQNDIITSYKKYKWTIKLSWFCSNVFFNKKLKKNDVKTDV